MNAQLRSFLAAVQYFTRLPVPASVGHSQQLLDDASRYFPAVGLLVGVISATALLLASFLWQPVVAAIIAVATSIWLTGAFHEDGLADATDGLGGGYGQQRILEIMRDSRIGTYGTLALVLAISLRVAVLSALPVTTACVLLIVGHAASRFAAVVLMWCLPYVREDDSKAKPLSRNLSRSGLWVAATTTVVVVGMGAVLEPALLGGIVPGVLVIFWWYRVLRRNLQGYTGDCLGAAQQLAELGLFLGMLAAWYI